MCFDMRPATIATLSGQQLYIVLYQLLNRNTCPRIINILVFMWRCQLWLKFRTSLGREFMTYEPSTKGSYTAPCLQRHVVLWANTLARVTLTTGEGKMVDTITGGSSRRLVGDTWRRVPFQGTPKTENSYDLAHYFCGWAQSHFRKNVRLGDSIQFRWDFGILKKILQFWTSKTQQKTAYLASPGLVTTLISVKSRLKL